ncbi:DAK2 domain-containing protein [Amycolatopsis sp. NPDC023774]|uniref:DAK2 domain-containing protein n=1 Tax=Amycolatopsis sp. NPDC023774 TaxID=3155015 RepID=UPI003411BDF2
MRAQRFAVGDRRVGHAAQARPKPATNRGRRDGPGRLGSARRETLRAPARCAADAAHAGTASASHLLAKRGRAGYGGENARGGTDPGARMVALFFEAAA